MLAEPLGAEMAAGWGLMEGVDDDSLMAEAQETAMKLRMAQPSDWR